MTWTRLKPFLDEDRPEVRRAALLGITDAPSGLPDEWAAELCFDPIDMVRRTAAQVLKQRQPWLGLRPYPVRPVPDSVVETPRGRAWHHTRQGLRSGLKPGLSMDTKKILSGLTELPGLLPDLLELAPVDKKQEVEDLLEQTSHSGPDQVLLAPTYRCNLDCSYCYAKGWDRHFPEDMALDHLTFFFDWCGHHQIEQLVLAGGEPTLYHHFDRLTALARDRKIRLLLTTNGLYSDEVGAMIQPEAFGLVVGHFDQERMIPGNPLFTRFKANMRAARAAGIDTVIRYTVTEQSNSVEWRAILNLNEALNISQLNFAFAFANYQGNNDFFNMRGPIVVNGIGNMLQELANDCLNRGIQLHLCKPIPLCLIQDDLLKFFLLEGILRSACAAHLRHCSRNLTVNPDLSTFPCNAIPQKGPQIARDRSPVESARSHAETINRLFRAPYIKSCPDCLFYYRGFCCGACLAEKQGKAEGYARYA